MICKKRKLCKNIIQHKVMEEALRISRETLSLAAKMAHFGSWIYDSEANLFEFDNECYAIYGTDLAREGPFMTPDVYARKFVHPDDAWIVQAGISKALSSTECRYSSQVKHRIIRRDGEVRTIVVQSNVVRDATGKIVRWYGSNQDITDHQAMEEALWASKEQLSLAMELANLGPWKYDYKTNLFEFDNEFYAIYGTSVAREGRFMAPDVYTREFVYPADTRIVEMEVAKALSSKKCQYSVQVEHRIIRRDGEVRTIVVLINIIRDADGKVVRWYGANQDITERKRTEEALRQKTEEIQRMAYTDVLTGLANRAHLNKLLELEMEKARRGEATGAVLFIDLDDLKTVNDTLGHAYGDDLIIEAGNRIVEEAGNDAFVGRIGGDEFVVILPGESDRRSITRIANRIIVRLCQDIKLLGELFHISASAGAAIYPDDGDTAEEIFKNADNAMYAAKNAGKNCWRFYEAAMQMEAYKKMLLTNSLHYAVKRGELFLHYQPQVSVADGVIIGFEALLRWNSQEHGLIPPLQFIPLAERNGLIHTIGGWVLREACRFARRLADNGWGNLHVAINVSPCQLCANGFVDNVSDALNNAGIEPRQIELEITESALIASLAESVHKLGELQELGVGLALDDFGTGYSSLTYLQRLPVKTLKIDKSFIDMILEDGAHKAIIGAIADMAHIMGMTVIAEGVETEEQIKYLSQCHCDCLQGYIISRPVPEESAIRFLARRAWLGDTL